MSHYYSNAGIILTTVNNHKERVLILLYWDYKENGWRWDIPYGGKKKKDKGPFQTMQREFEEEVGFKLPWISHSVNFVPCTKSITYFKCMGSYRYKIPSTKSGWKLSHTKREHVKGFLLNVKEIDWKTGQFKIGKNKQKLRKEAFKSLEVAKKKKLFRFI